MNLGLTKVNECLLQHGLALGADVQLATVYVDG